MTSMPRVQDNLPSLFPPFRTHASQLAEIIRCAAPLSSWQKHTYAAHQRIPESAHVRFIDARRPARVPGRRQHCAHGLQASAMLCICRPCSGTIEQRAAGRWGQPAANARACLAVDEDRDGDVREPEQQHRGVDQPRGGRHQVVTVLSPCDAHTPRAVRAAAR